MITSLRGGMIRRRNERKRTLAELRSTGGKKVHAHFGCIGVSENEHFYFVFRAQVDDIEHMFALLSIFLLLNKHTTPAHASANAIAGPRTNTPARRADAPTHTAARAKYYLQ